jgi:hypothetical protein
MSEAAPLRPAPEAITKLTRVIHLDVRRRDRLGGILHECEHTVGWFMLHRRLVRDYGTRQESLCTMIQWSITGVMNRALTRASTPTWQGSTGKAV